MTDSPHQPAPPPASPPTGILRLTLQGSMMTSSPVVPTCTINGHPVPTRYGTQDLVVWAGPTTIALEAQWMRTYGQASMTLDVPPGQVVEVYYAAPWHQFTTGSIGVTKQPRKGTGFLVGCLVVPVVLVLVVILVAALGAGLS